MSKELKVSNWTIARFWLILLAILGSLALVYWARTGIVLVLVGLFLAVAIDPLVKKIAKTLKIKRTGATALSFLTIFVVIVLALVLIIPNLASQLTIFSKTFPTQVSQIIDDVNKSDFLLKNHEIKEVAFEVGTKIRANINVWMSDVAGSLFAKFTSAIAFFAQLMVVLVLAFLISIDSDKIKKNFLDFMPKGDSRKRASNIISKTYKVITGFVGGQLTIVVIAGSLAGVTALILSMFFADLPASVSAPVAISVGFFSLLPMVGAIIGSSIAALLIAFSSPIAAIIFLVYCVIYQQIENQIIIPKIQSKNINLSTLTTLIAVTIGIYWGGIVGGLIAIPIAGIIKVVVDEFSDEVDYELFKTPIKKPKKKIFLARKK